MKQPLSQQQPITNLNPIFHSDLEQIKRERLLPDELILYVADCGHYGGFGYCVVASRRIINVRFDTHQPAIFGPKRETITMYKYPTIGGNLTLRVVKPVDPISSREAKSRRISEHQLAAIQGVERQDFLKRLAGKEETVVMLRPKIEYVKHDVFMESLFFYNIRDGQEVYKLLQAGMSGDLRPVEIKGHTQAIPVIAEQLEKLAELHRYQVITDEEYEAAKKRLLG